MEKYTQYILAHRENIAALITTHVHSLPHTTTGDHLRRHLMDHIATLSGTRGPVAPRQLCKDTYTLLGEIATAHQQQHRCLSAGPGACPYLKKLYATRAAMARAGVIY